MSKPGADPTSGIQEGNSESWKLLLARFRAQSPGSSHLFLGNQCACIRSAFSRSSDVSGGFNSQTSSVLQSRKHAALSRSTARAQSGKQQFALGSIRRRAAGRF